MAARVTGSPVLRCVADGYERAARAPYGRIPGRTRYGDQLRTAARLLAMTGQATGAGAGPAWVLAAGLVALAAGLVALADAVAALRDAQAQATQTAAARQAAEHLHRAFTRARSRPPDGGAAPGQAARPGPAGRAAAEFPIPLADVLSAAASRPTATPARPYPAARPPTRAKPAPGSATWRPG
jgi:hypothetical protein